ncbi:MAG TPA: tetratricopeptide repeat protein [Methylomirabilota bacterium]|nr:tetratricopeptide repeat protein [Methylomirabilota bacterium]
MLRLLLLLAVAVTGCATVAPPAPMPPPAPSGGSITRDQPATPGPTPAPASPAQAALDRGQALLARGDFTSAATAFREAIRLQPDLVQARAGLGRALYGLGDLDAAVTELRAALRQRPDTVAARLTLAHVLVARQEWPLARAELERVLLEQPDLLDARYTLGVVRYGQGDAAGAIDAYRRVLAADPEQPDARYNLALLLRLDRRDAEATAEFLVAARAGHALAEYFAGAALASGLGVDRDLASAVTWWFRAAEQGTAQAEEALAQLRQVALGRGRRGPAERQAAQQAFAEYRTALWNDFPDVARGADDSVGGALLRQGRAREAVPVLIREAAALSEPAQRLLETIYERGVDGELPARDPRVLGSLEAAAAEGRRPPIR